jgi:hypothetical protein
MGWPEGSDPKRYSGSCYSCIKKQDFLVISEQLHPSLLVICSQVPPVLQLVRLV